MGRVYIAGPIAGIPDGNRRAFADQAAKLRAAGHEPVNPWDISPDGHPGPHIGEVLDHHAEHRYGCHLRADIIELMQCDAITLLDGWQNSRGARTEHHVAESIGLPTIEV